MKNTFEKEIANWIINDLQHLHKISKIPTDNCPINVENMMVFIWMIHREFITRIEGKELFKRMFYTQKSPFTLIIEDLQKN